jgi:hypothetical protein
MLDVGVPLCLDDRGAFFVVLDVAVDRIVDWKKTKSRLFCDDEYDDDDDE